MLGTKHQSITDWLVGHWKSDTARICLIEGFSGVGKTEVASEFQRRSRVDARVDAPESGELDDLLLDLGQQLAASGHRELADAVSSGTSTEAALESVLQKDVCIIVDEFQRMMDDSSAIPIPRLAALLERISKRAAPGRVLALSHRALDKTTRWGERVLFKTLEGLLPQEGAQLLGDLLGQRGRGGEVPPVRRAEISRWLGGNPRAIRVLVGCLENEALDDLTGVVPEAWEAKDQQVSEGLIARLERELLVRALEKLDGASASALEACSVYRKPVGKDAVTRQLGPEQKTEQFMSTLSSRFLLQQRGGWYALNPVVREISLHRLKNRSRTAKAAHKAAAGYYTRHFTAKQIVGAGTLGSEFVEARYHLVQAEETSELSEIAMRFGQHLRSLYSWVTPTVDATRRDEVIGVLSAYLESAGPKAMEYYLARLLFERGRAEDHGRALMHARRSTGGEARADAWVLRLRLELGVGGIEEMMMAARNGFAAVPAHENLFAVYQFAAEELSEKGRTADAFDVLQEGMSKVPSDKGLFSLYIAQAELLVKGGEVEDAIILLRQALTTLRADDLSSIYHRIAIYLTDKGQGIDAIELLGEGVNRVPARSGLAGMYVDLANRLAACGRNMDAIGVLEDGLQKIAAGADRASLQSALFTISKSATQPSTKPSTSSGKIAAGETDTARRASSILIVGTEWHSRHGGLSTFNRDLCVELAAAGHRVLCVVPEVQPTELESARAAGVELVVPPAQAGLERDDLLLTELSLPKDFTPDFVIGHDRKTGPHAAVIVKRFPNSKFVFFLHTRPEDIEWHKDRFGEDDSATTAEIRRGIQQQLAGSASLVVGVGPGLTNSARSLVYLANPQPLVHELDPGIRKVTRPAAIPPETHCLVLGRAEDFKLKGLDIAAHALGRASKRRRLPSAPRLIVRGAPPGTGRQLREQLIALAGGVLDIEVRDYSPDVVVLQQDILTASILLMPSRSEGFGLVAVEAIAAGCPVLVSDRSGLAALLKQRLGTDAEQLIVETPEDLDASAIEWERAIEMVLYDRVAAFRRAKDFQDKAVRAFTWSDAIRRLEVAWAPLFGTQR